MKKIHHKEKNTKLEVSDLWGKSGGARHPQKIDSDGRSGRRGPSWRRTGSGFGWSDFIVGCLIQEVEIQFGKPSSHLLLAKFETLDEGIQAELDL